MNSAVPEKYIQRELLAVIENKFIRLEFCQGVWNCLFLKIILKPAISLMLQHANSLSS